MTKRMLIDANHPEETRVVVLDGTRLEEFDVETSTKKQLKGNIYLAKVVRVEPSLQAAFVDYGGNRHGFLAFNEIHPDYYQIPVADREKLLAEEAADSAEDEDEDGNGESVETLGGDESDEAAPAPRAKARMMRQYKIQEVIKRRQILLVQVVKEERGNKGAALTTYLSLAGRYCVFMPNTTRGGGVSRKITSATDRKRLKTIMSDLQGPRGSAVILRTAGAERSKAEIKRDYEYLLRTWDLIRTTTLESRAPTLIHEEGSLIKRAIRDIYSRDIEEIIVDGDLGYRTAKDFMKMLTPSHAKKVQPYRDDTMPLFHRYQVESQMDAMHSPIAQLRSGGYIVINQTEALVAIDVNSGRSTRERNIEETAYKTNLEAADEIARQLRLRDLSGLIVIDFIDMDDNRSNTNVERRLKDALRNDRARIQLGRISHFGLLELSRQRLRPSLMETSFETCPHCHGTGSIRSVESTALHVLRLIEEEGVRRRSCEVTMHVPTMVALYVLNYKRSVLAAIEQRYDFKVYIQGSDELIIPDYRMDRVKDERTGEDADTMAAPQPVPAAPVSAPTPAIEDEDDSTEENTDRPEDAGDTETSGDGAGEDQGGRGKRRRRRRRRRKGGDRDGEFGQDGTSDEKGDSDGEDDTDQDGDDEGDTFDTGERIAAEGDDAGNDAEGTDDDEDDGDESSDDGGEGSSGGRSRRSRRRRSRRSDEPVEAQDGEAPSFVDTISEDGDDEGSEDVSADGGDGGDAGEGGSRRRRRPRRRGGRGRSGGDEVRVSEASDGGDGTDGEGQPASDADALPGPATIHPGEPLIGPISPQPAPEPVAEEETEAEPVSDTPEAAPVEAAFAPEPAEAGEPAAEPVTEDSGPEEDISNETAEPAAEDAVTAEPASALDSTADPEAAAEPASEPVPDPAEDASTQEAPGQDPSTGPRRTGWWSRLMNG